MKARLEEHWLELHTSVCVYGGIVSGRHLSGASTGSLLSHQWQAVAGGCWAPACFAVSAQTCCLGLLFNICHCCMCLHSMSLFPCSWKAAAPDGPVHLSMAWPTSASLLSAHGCCGRAARRSFACGSQDWLRTGRRAHYLHEIYGAH